MIDSNFKVKIQSVRNRKEKTIKKVEYILREICSNNLDVFKKEPEFRLKKNDGIIRKIKKKKCTKNNFEKEIVDIAGARLTVCTIDEIEFAEKLIRNHADVKKCDLVRDYKETDEFGYKAHHLIIKVQISYENKTVLDSCEIQIRTLSQDLWAVLSHRDFYKSISRPSPYIQKDMVAFSKLLDAVDDFALSFKERRRIEIDKAIKEKSRKVTDKQKLTIENIDNYLKKKFGETLSNSELYDLLNFLLEYEFTKLKQFDKVISDNNLKKIMLSAFEEQGKVPVFTDYLYAPVIMFKHGKNILTDSIKELNRPPAVQPVEGESFVKRRKKINRKESRKK